MLLHAVLVGLGLVSSSWAHPAPVCDQELGAVATESSICSNIGIGILREGGNAADALIAQQFCVGVIGMQHSGVGGGGFMLVRSSNGSYEFIDFREMAPAAAFETMYSPPLSNANYSLYGGLASGVPGELRGLEHLHKNYATMPWKHLMQPAIKVARYGFNVTEDLVRYMASATAGTYDFLTYDETWALDFAPNGARLGLGDLLTRKRYANTLESIAEYGPDAFYTGAIANATITALQKSNGTMTLSDLANYTVEIRQTSNITYRGFKMHSGSAPSSGAVVMSIMKIVEGYDMSSPSQLNFSTHYMDEAMRFAYGQRTELGDPTFSPNLTDYQIRMYSEKTAEEVRSKIEEFHTLNASAYDPDGYGILTDSGTSAGVASDRSGLTIAITSTVNTLFGSQLMVPETGVIMNNEMNDFSIPNTTNAFGYIPTEANFIRPFKRPLSSISPSIVEFPNGTVYISHASAGGSRIITEVAQHLWHVIDQNMTSAQSLAQPRMHDQLSPNLVYLEYGSPFQHVEGYNNETAAFLTSIGANVTFVAPGSTTAQALRRLGNGTFEAAGDPRQLNSAGYAI
ncbi:Gamma-glutamyltranspeptidase [Hyphodiscus hymeniophilus]|uniref:Glutathione hydrolase n=1 Tax=Hyphodiscus hymeniophilus TaxID=353542 RepID=A0A9P7AZR0_9HELO|nr:Gamma-glutamyltranspeptidase [Hyphodiscus hymeniophilus]